MPLPARRRRRPALVSERSGEVAHPEKEGREKRGKSRPETVDYQTEEGDGKVGRYFADDGDGVDFSLGVVEAGLEEGRVEGECGDGAAGETGN